MLSLTLLQKPSIFGEDWVLGIHIIYPQSAPPPTIISCLFPTMRTIFLAFTNILCSFHCIIFNYTENTEHRINKEKEVNICNRQNLLICCLTQQPAQDLQFLAHKSNETNTERNPVQKVCPKIRTEFLSHNRMVQAPSVLREQEPSNDLPAHKLTGSWFTKTCFF